MVTPCGHIFCKLCINIAIDSYSTTTSEHSNKAYFSCPKCRKQYNKKKIKSQLIHIYDTIPIVYDTTTLDQLKTEVNLVKSQLTQVSITRLYLLILTH